MVALALDEKDTDLFFIAQRVLKLEGIRNLQPEFIDEANYRILFADSDTAEQARHYLEHWSVHCHIHEEDLETVTQIGRKSA